MKTLLATLALTLGLGAMSPAAARADDRTWVSVGQVKMLTVNDDDDVQFEAATLSRCDGTSSLYVTDLSGRTGKSPVLGYVLPLLLSAMANRYEVRVVLDEDCEDTKGLPGNNLGHFGRDVDRWQGANPEEYWWYSDGLATPLAVRSARRTWLGYFPAVPRLGKANMVTDLMIVAK